MTHCLNLHKGFIDSPLRQKFYWSYVWSYVAGRKWLQTITVCFNYMRSVSVSFTNETMRYTQNCRPWKSGPPYISRNDGLLALNIGTPDNSIKRKKRDGQNEQRLKRSH